MHRRFFKAHLVIPVLVGLAAIAAVTVVAAQLGVLGSSEDDSGGSTSSPAESSDPNGGEHGLTNPPAESSDPNAVAGNSNMSVEDALAFSEFPLYWLGEMYEGLELTTLKRVKYGPEIALIPQNNFTFLYGKCVVRGDGGCPAPFSVLVRPLCLSRPGTKAPMVHAGELFTLRGALAQEYTDGHLELGIGSVSVTLFGPSRELMKAMAQHLRPVAGPGQAPSEAGAPLSPANSVDVC